MKALENQSLFDMAVIIGGSAEYAIELAMMNGLSITDDILANQQIDVYNNATMPSNRIVSFYKNRGIRPATANTLVHEELLTDTGIDFWAIEDDFVIGVSEGIDFDEIEHDFIIAN